jgi:hypothetical protein
MKSITPSEQLEKHTRRTPSCWLWTGHINQYGYGRFGRKHFAAHRVAYEVYIGPIPDGLCVLHTCDVRHCVNPAHLWLGTKGDNNRDCVRKGRYRNGFLAGTATVPQGEQVSTARLTEDNVHEIRRLYIQGTTQKEIAARFGVTQTNISCIVRGKTWTHI